MRGRRRRLWEVVAMALVLLFVYTGVGAVAMVWRSWYSQVSR